MSVELESVDPSTIVGIVTPEELQKLANEGGFLGTTITYFIAGLEYAPSSGRVHWQGFARFKNAMTMKTAKKRLGKILYKPGCAKKKILFLLFSFLHVGEKQVWRQNSSGCYTG